jgi:hypothetical protein
MKEVEIRRSPLSLVLVLPALGPSLYQFWVTRFEIVRLLNGIVRVPMYSSVNLDFCLTVRSSVAFKLVREISNDSSHLGCVSLDTG